MQFGRFLNDKRWRHEGKTKQSSFPQILLPRQVFSSAASSNLWETDRVNSSPCEISSIIPRAFLNVLKTCQEDCSYSLTTVSGEVILLLSWQSLVLSRLSLNINWRHSTSIQPQGSSYGNKPLSSDSIVFNSCLKRSIEKYPDSPHVHYFSSRELVYVFPRSGFLLLVDERKCTFHKLKKIWDDETKEESTNFNLEKKIPRET